MKKTPKLRFKEFSGDWETATLGDSAYIKGRIGWKNLKQEEYTEQGPYLIAGKHINNGKIDWDKCDHIPMERYDESPEIALKNNDIIFSKDGSLGNPAIIENLKSEATINGTMMLVRLENTSIYPKYFYYILNSKYFKKLINDLKSGSSIPHIFQRDIVEFKFPITDIKEQEKLSNFFSLIDNKISLQSEKVEALKDYKKGIMQKIFSRELRFKYDDGRDYPEWEEKKFKDFVKINQGLQIAISDRYTTEGENRYFYITNEFLKANSETKYYIENPPNSVICNEDDILMTRTGNTGKVVTGVSGAFHNNFFKIDYDKNKYNKMFLYYVLTSQKIQKNIIRLAGSSTIPDLNHGDFYNIKIKIPTYAEQNKIANILMKLDNKIQKEQEKLDSLNEYKKGLLQQMFI